MIHFCYLEDEGQDIKLFCDFLNKYSKKNHFSFEGDIYHLKSKEPSLLIEETGNINIKNINIIDTGIESIDKLYSRVIENKYNLYILDLRIEPFIEDNSSSGHFFRNIFSSVIKNFKRGKNSYFENMPGIFLFNKIINEVKNQKPKPVVALLSNYAGLKTDEMITTGRKMASEYGVNIPIYLKGEKTNIVDGYDDLFYRMKEISDTNFLTSSDLTSESLKKIDDILSFSTHDTLMPNLKNIFDYLDLLVDMYDSNIVNLILKRKNKSIDELKKCEKDWIFLENERFSINNKVYLISLNYIPELSKAIDKVLIKSVTEFIYLLKNIDISKIGQNDSNGTLKALHRESKNIQSVFFKPLKKFKELVRTSNNRIFKMAIENVVKSLPQKKIKIIDNLTDKKYMIFYRKSDLLLENGNFSNLLKMIISNYCKEEILISLDIVKKKALLLRMSIKSNFPVMVNELFNDNSRDDAIILRKIVGAYASLIVKTDSSKDVRNIDFFNMPADLSTSDIIKLSTDVEKNETIFSLFFKGSVEYN